MSSGEETRIALVLPLYGRVKQLGCSVCTAVLIFGLLLEIKTLMICTSMSNIDSNKNDLIKFVVTYHSLKELTYAYLCQRNVYKGAVQNNVCSESWKQLKIYL